MDNNTLHANKEHKAMTKREAKREAQNEVLVQARNAFLSVADDRTLNDNETDRAKILTQVEIQMARIERLFGHTGW